MLEYKTQIIKYKNIQTELANLINKNVEQGWNFVETQIITNYTWSFSSQLLVIFSREK